MTTLTNISKKLHSQLSPQFVKENVKKIINTDGRKRGAPKSCRKSSSVYILYSNTDEVLYVGETGTSIKNRLCGDGSGSHDKKSWFSEVSYLQYYESTSKTPLTKQERKLLEQAFSIVLKPKYYK